MTVPRAEKRDDELPVEASSDTYEHLKSCFFGNGDQSPVDRVVRADMVRRFEKIDAGLPIVTTPSDGLVLAELAISSSGEGDLVECGSYAGGSTAKLSVVAEALGKRLVVFDSFAGLPQPRDDDHGDHHLRRADSWFRGWWAGRYSASLGQVQDNVREFGVLDVCTFVQGWFDDTLVDQNIPEAVSLAFADVDLASSAQQCLRRLWPRLSVGGIFASHDVAYVKVLLSLLDEKLWATELREFPPILFGAGFGLGNTSPHLGYFVKGRGLDASYLKNLTIER